MTGAAGSGGGDPDTQEGAITNGGATTDDAAPAGFARSFLGEQAAFLRDVYVPRLRRAAAILPAGDTWWRPHADALSAGGILLHLRGNVRQWIVCGLGGARDDRDRAAEFAAVDGPAADALLDALERTVAEAAAVIEAFDVTRLLEPITLQTFETTPSWAIQHVVEHFSWHTGQFVMLAKQRAGPGHGLSYYDDAALARARNPDP